MPNGNKSLLWSTAIFLTVVLADQLTKIWALSTLSLHESTEVLGRFFMFTLVFNQGGAMGTNIGSSVYYLVASILILLFVLYYTWANRNYPRVAYPLAFIAGGAVGNIIDRIRLGHVVDFIDVDFFNISLFGWSIDRWWAFNIADAAITCSIVFLVATVVIWRPKEEPGSDAPSDPAPAD